MPGSRKQKTMADETVRFTMYGASDDLIESEGIPGCDEWNVSPLGRREGGHAATFLLAGDRGKLRIMAFYWDVWFFAIAQVAEGQPLPDWPVEIVANEPRPGVVGYSTELRIDVPKGTILARLAT